MKYLFLSAAIVFNSMHLFSQCISVELSIHWEKEYPTCSLSKDDFCLPYLHITYRNDSNDTLYFMKVAPQDVNDFPTFFPADIGLLQYSDRGPGEKMHNDSPLYEDHSNMHFVVILRSDPFYLSAWEVIQDNFDPHNMGYEGSPINDELNDIYSYLSNNGSDSLSEIKEIKLNYTASDIKPEFMMDKFKDRFVFLMPGETCVDTFNLIGFKLVKGSFTFQVRNTLPTYVMTSIWDETQNKHHMVETMLPKSVGDYKLYSGNLKSNKVSIKF